MYGYLEVGVGTLLYGYREGGMGICMDTKRVGRVHVWIQRG